MQTAVALTVTSLILFVWSRWLKQTNGSAVALIIALAALLNVAAQDYALGLLGLAYSLLAAILIVLLTKGN
jgi:predicted membrane metal-binding protein